MTTELIVGLVIGLLVGFVVGFNGAIIVMAIRDETEFEKERHEAR